ncbi:MAG TPA: hypothetical protein VK633_14470 [Verrucomicrobiae bacterium]|nr:hypothetical protein [Verrucomicrobiae bacterium]
MKQPRPIKALEGLTDDQLNQLAEWVDLHSYRKAVELAHANFGRSIPKTTLQRFIAHRRAAQVLDDSPEALNAAREINRFAATAETNFSAATLHLLERQAFELALARSDQEDLDALKDLLFLLQRHRANDIHDRRVRVQEEKLALRKAEIAAEANSAAEGDTFSAVVDHVLKNHPAFLAGAAHQPAEAPLHRGNAEDAEGNQNGPQVEPATNNLKGNPGSFVGSAPVSGVPVGVPPTGPNVRKTQLKGEDNRALEVLHETPSTAPGDACAPQIGLHSYSSEMTTEAL